MTIPFWSHYQNYVLKTNVYLFSNCVNFKAFSSELYKLNFFFIKENDLKMNFFIFKNIKYIKTLIKIYLLVRVSLSLIKTNDIII